MTSGKRADRATGWLVDIACLRRYAGGELARRASVHTTACARMGHCVESGYGLVDPEGRLHLLDTHATPLVVDLLRTTENEQGIRIEAERHSQDGEMETVAVRELVGRQSAYAHTQDAEAVGVDGRPAHGSGESRIVGCNVTGRLDEINANGMR